MYALSTAALGLWAVSLQTHSSVKETGWIGVFCSYQSGGKKTTGANVWPVAEGKYMELVCTPQILRFHGHTCCCVFSTIKISKLFEAINVTLSELSGSTTAGVERRCWWRPRKRRRPDTGQQNYVDFVDQPPHAKRYFSAKTLLTDGCSLTVLKNYPISSRNVILFFYIYSRYTYQQTMS